MTTKTKWHSGAPPCIGWWPASMMEYNGSIRWWDGKYWSESAFPKFSSVTAASCSEKKSARQKAIKWCARWWE